VNIKPTRTGSVTIMNYRKKYILEYGTPPKGHEIHHKLPIRLGGSHDISNLEAVDRETHSNRHLKLYEKSGDIKDLTSHYLLRGEYPPELRQKIAAIGGKIGGPKTAKEVLGIHAGSKEQRSAWGKLGALAEGWIIQRKKKLGIFNPNNQKKYSSLGGIACGHFQDSKFQSEMGKRGGKKNKESVWMTDGTTTIKYTKAMQSECSIEQFLKENQNYRLGRTYKRKPLNEN